MGERGNLLGALSRLTAALAWMSCIWLAAAPPLLGEGLNDKLAQLRQRHENGSEEAKTFDFTEVEANNFLRNGGVPQLPRGVSSPWIAFEEGAAVVGATLDLDQLGDELPDSMLFQLLSGQVPVEVVARLSGQNGSGTLELERVTLSGVDLPQSLVDTLIEGYDTSKILPPGFRLGEPFALPYDVESIRCQPKSVLVEQKATKR